MGKDVLADGPVMKRVDLEGDVAVITFESVGAGLEKRRVVMARSPQRGAPDDPGPIIVSAAAVKGFEVCGADDPFVEAEARLVGVDRVELRTEGVDKIKHVRYAFVPFPLCNLYNSAGLPARPFRTDAFDVAYGAK